jgi:hypothetical protein
MFDWRILRSYITRPACGPRVVVQGKAAVVNPNNNREGLDTTCPVRIKRERPNPAQKPISDQNSEHGQMCQGDRDVSALVGVRPKEACSRTTS